jgi:hypothetical protein
VLPEHCAANPRFGYDNKNVHWQIASRLLRRASAGVALSNHKKSQNNKRRE